MLALDFEAATGHTKNRKEGDASGRFVYDQPREERESPGFAGVFGSSTPTFPGAFPLRPTKTMRSFQSPGSS